MRTATSYLSRREPPCGGLKTSFNEAVCRALGTQLPSRPGDICIEFDNADVVNLLLKNQLLTSASVRSGEHLIGAAEAKVCRKLILRSLDLIRDLDRWLHFMICTLIATVACYRIPGTEGGSVSSCIGLIYLNPSPDWSREFCGEMLVHEFVHNAVFLEDMVRGVFPDYALFGDKGAFAISTLRRTKRPFDKAYHSACVAVGLLYFYHLLGDAGKERELAPRLRATLAELEACDQRLMRGGKEVLTENGRQLAAEMRRFAASLDYGMIAVALELEGPETAELVAVGSWD
jgi:hypothetical protein